MALYALEQEIKESGFNQPDLIKLLKNLITQVNELKDDHATFKTVVTANKTAINAVITAAATNIAAVAAVTPVSSSAPATLTNTSDIVLTRG